MRTNDLKAYVSEQSINSDVVIACIDAFFPQVDKPTVIVVNQSSINISDAIEYKLPECQNRGLNIFVLPSYSPRITQSIQQWSGLAGYEAGKLLRSLRDKADQWWYFLDHPEVPPDNNLAERSLRLAVTKRKVGGGSRSMDRFTQTVTPNRAIQTCRRQGRSVMEFFKQALMAQSGSEVSNPSLLPQPTT